MADDYRRVIVTHTINHVRAALQAAQQARKPAILQSAPDAIHYAGALYLLTMYQQARESIPGVESVFILDCGDAAAEALAAMQAGHHHLRCNVAAEYLEKLRDIADQLNVTIVQGECEALDLHVHYDVPAACKTWFDA